MKRYWGILKIYMRNETLAKLEYRGALWADIVFFVFGYGTQFFLTFILVDKFEMLAGWSPFEAMLLYAMSILSYTLACTFLRGPSMGLESKIREGHFDQTLTKPLNPLAYEIVSSFSAYYLMHVLLGVAMVAVCFIGLGIQLTFVKLLMFILAIIGGAMIQGAALLLFASMSFFLVGYNPFVYGVFATLRTLNENPVSIYPKAVQVFLTIIMPFAFVSFYPAQHFLGKSDFLMFGPAVQFLTPVVGAVFLFIAGKVWLWGVGKYQSSGT